MTDAKNLPPSDVGDAEFAPQAEYADDWAVAVNADAEHRHIPLLVESEKCSVSARSAAAERTLLMKGYTYTDGAELWKPPVGRRSLVPAAKS